MAQRLVRKLDDDLKQAYEPSEAEWAKIHEVLTTLPEGAPWPNLEGLKLFKPGTSDENPYGFKGQIAIREQFTMTESLRHLLETPNANLSGQSIEEAARAGGMKTMLQDAVLKVIAGQTTFDEIFRVVS